MTKIDTERRGRWIKPDSEVVEELQRSLSSPWSPLLEQLKLEDSEDSLCDRSRERTLNTFDLGRPRPAIS